MWRGAVLCLGIALSGCKYGDGVKDWTRNDIAQLSVAAGNFKQKFGRYPPSRVKLSESCAYPERDRPGTLDADSVALLQRIWSRLDLSPGTEIDWNGDGAAKGDWILEGDECLVFFLGGVQVRQPNGCVGFSTDARHPMSKPTRSDEERLGPFFDFYSSRLRDVHGRGFFSYLDGFGQPFVYFASPYNRHGGTDCPTLGVWPYAEALEPWPRFHNPDTFQIISAGPDGKFGPGTDNAAHVWSPATAASIPADGRDDVSNFHPRPLGIP